MYMPRTAERVSASKFPPLATRGEVSRSVGRSPQSAPLMRKYAAACLSEDGGISEMERLAPATPDFEQAFSAFTHSTQIYAPGGPIQASDLIPGDIVTTASGQERRVVWIGSMTGVPTMEQPELPNFKLVRISADTFGLDRPMGDLTLAPSAVISAGYEDISAGDRADGDSICQLMPQSSVRMFHVMLDRPAHVLANGLPVASYVPNTRFVETMGPNRKALFTSFFENTSFNFAEV